MALGSDIRRRGGGGPGNDMYYQNSAGLWVPVAGTKTAGFAPIIQADGSFAYGAAGGGGGGGSGVAGTAGWSFDGAPTTPSSLDDEFNGPTLDPKWTAIGALTKTPVFRDGLLELAVVGPGAVVPSASGYEQPLPSGNFSIVSSVRCLGGQYTVAGIHVRNATTGAMIRFTLHQNSGSATDIYMGTSRYSSLTTRTSVVSEINRGQHEFLLRISYDGTNLYCDYGYHADDGIYWYPHTQEAIGTTFGGGVPDRIGVSLDPFGTGTFKGAFRFFRYYSTAKANTGNLIGGGASGVVEPLTPSDIPDLYRWFKSDAGVTMDGSNRVSLWADQSGNAGGDATQATTAKMPVFTAGVLDGYGSLRFASASAQELNFLLNGIVGSAYTIMVLAARRSDPAGYLLGAVTGGTTNASLHLGWQGGSAWSFRHWGNDFDTSIESYAANRFHCFFNVLNTSNGRKTEAFDGSTVGVLSSTATLGSIPGGGVIGQAVGTYGNYDVIEIAAWTVALTRAQRDGVRAYLGARYPSAILSPW